MAQDYIGTNNLPLLAKEGNFGKRFTNAAAAPRYIYTYGSPILFQLMNKNDTAILKEQFFEGNKIEPAFYLPELPLLIINGSNGIASGFKQMILPRDQKAVLRYLKKRLNGTIKKQFDALPYFQGFTGTVEKDTDNRFKISGVAKRINTTTVEITEIPVGIELAKYISILQKLKDKDVIKGFTDKSDKEKFNFIISFTRQQLKKLDTDEKLYDTLKLIKYETEIYNAVDEDNAVETFKSIGDIFDYYIKVKLKYTQNRKDYLLQKYADEIAVDNSKYYFIKGIVDGTIKVNNRKTDAIIKDLEKIDEILPLDSNYKYLLNMNIHSLTKEKLKQLKDSITAKKQLIKDLKKKKLEEIWLDDLNNLNI
jgi:DNA topoisomerase-2